MGRVIVVAIMLFCSPAWAARGHGEGDDAVDFQRDVRPILADRCFPCHGPDAAARRGELRLDQREDALAFAIVPGEPASSPLLARVTHADPAERMPPADSSRATLAADEVDTLARWIAAGALYGEHWSYAPLARPAVPAGADETWPLGAVDRFVAAALDERGIAPAPEADRRTLARRLFFDLTGLPPSYEELEAFVRDERPEAYDELVERLLTSPAHAERLAVYWLDLVRYGDSSGYHSDRPIPAWPYRDWVLRAFEDNMPFDRFTIEQIAGDLLADAGEGGEEQRIAAVYNRLNKTTDEGGAQAGEYVVKYAADRVRTTASVWLGATMGCAECHDHKFDPLPQRDFYRMAAFFADIEEVGVYELKEYRGFQPLMQIDDGESSCLATVSREPRTVRVLPRGNWLDESGEVVEPGTPDCWPPLAAGDRRATRLDLARWLVRPDHPLTARVLVNRLWFLFFGEGLSRVLDDFGRQGDFPSHPQLLDWLGAELVDSGWDVRHVVRTLVTSRTYRQSAARRPELLGVDPENHLFARQVPWRLDAEFVRDAALAISGLLDPRVGGPSVKPYQPAGYWQHLNFPTRKWTASEGADQHRRGLYTHWQRTYVHPGLLALDAPSREETTVRRSRSNTPLAALALLDDPTYVEAARAFAARVLTEAPIHLRDRGEWAFQRALQRAPTARELEVLLALVTVERARFEREVEAARALTSVGVAPVAEALDPVEHAAWTQACRALLNLHETITRP